MKRFILIFTLLFLFPLKVYGLTDLGYMKLNNDYIIDTNDFKIEYGEWIPYNEEDIENIEIRREYTYRTINPLQYIQISNSNAIIEEIEVYYKNEKLNYALNTKNSNFNQRDYIYDGIINDSNKVLNLTYRTVLVLKLDKEYSLENIKVKIYLKNPNYNVDVFFCKDIYKYNNTIKKTIKLENKDNTIKIDDSWIFNTEYLEPIKTNEYIYDTWYRKVDIKSEYRTVTKLFRHYENDTRINNILESENETQLSIKNNISNNRILQNITTPKLYFNLNNNSSNISNNLVKDISGDIPNIIDDNSNNKKVDIKQASNNYKDMENKNIIQNFSKNKLILIIILLTIISVLLIYINKNYRRC